MYGKLQQKTSISGKAESTLNNYARCLAHLALHYKCSPEVLEQVEAYLYHLKKEHSTPSESFFKHTVYGIRYVCRILEMKDKYTSLPAIERQKKLPESTPTQKGQCPCCKKHTLAIVCVFDKRGPPQEWKDTIANYKNRKQKKMS